MGDPCTGLFLKLWSDTDLIVIIVLVVVVLHDGKVFAFRSNHLTILVLDFLSELGSLFLDDIRDRVFSVLTEFEVVLET